MANRECPSCSGAMKPFMVGKVEIDRCTFCRGIFFDGGELEQVLGKKLLGSVDRDKQTSRKCAACGGKMLSGVLGSVQVEVCEKDKGIFLDDRELVTLNDGKRVEVRQEEPNADVADWLKSLGV